MLREIMWIADLTVNPRMTVAKALLDNRFPINRVDPHLADEGRFPSRTKRNYPLVAKRFRIPAGYEENDIPQAMLEMKVKEPEDIREILVLGSQLVGLEFTYHIFAPAITGDPRRFIEFTALSLKPGFGLGILPPFHHNDVELGGLSLSDRDFLWFAVA